ncbi:expressed protein, partial [Phakopsora pachyrhizi]
PFRMNLSSPWILIFLTLELTTLTVICKCMCFSNYTIVPLYRPKDPTKPCLSCTKQFCLDQKLDICQNAQIGNTNLDTGTGEEGDIRTKCFQRDSAKDQAIVIGFLIITTGLLLTAMVKDHGQSIYQVKIKKVIKLWFYPVTLSLSLPCLHFPLFF